MLSTIVIDTPSATSDLTVLATLKSELSITDTASDTWLEDLIRQQSDIITRYCGRTTFGRETVTETFRLSSGDRGPLILGRDIAPSITSVVEDGTTLSATDYLLDGSLLYRLTDDVPSDWGAAKVVVVYAAGYTLISGLPYDLERACLDGCVRAYSARGRDPTLRSEATEGIGSRSWVDPDKGGGVIPAQVRDVIDRYRRIAI